VQGLPATPKGLSQHLKNMSSRLRYLGLRLESDRPGGASRLLSMTHHAS
jgi:hypothetical protein